MRRVLQTMQSTIQYQLFNKHNVLKTLVIANSWPTICTTVLLHWLRGGCCSNDCLHSNSVGFLWLQLNLAGDFYTFTTSFLDTGHFFHISPIQCTIVALLLEVCRELYCRLIQIQTV